MNEYIDTLAHEFKRNGNEEISVGQAQYMRNKFKFYGLKSALRREVCRPFILKESRPKKEDLSKYVRELWQSEYRDMQYFGMDLSSKYLKQTTQEDIELFQYMIENKSWWDTVDFVASTLVGNYFLSFPENKSRITNNWIESNNIWLQRSVLIFQLKYKDQVDLELLEKSIVRLNNTKEFFINKAIGWSLRSYARVDSDWVRDFVTRHDLSNLSRREALKHLA